MNPKSVDKHGDIFGKIQTINYRDVSKLYDNRPAIKNLTLEVLGGELLVLIGSSGSGKTTALRMVNRMVDLDKGHITINGKDIKEFDPIELRRHIGYVIQEIGLFDHMTVEENIGLIPKVEGWEDNEIAKRVEDLLELVSLPPEDFRDRYPDQLSGGQKQRVGLARGLAMDPPLILMDEPFGALDPILRVQLQDEFVKIRKELNKTIIFVTHDIQEGLKLGDRLAIIEKAELLQVNKPNQIITNPSTDFVADIVSADEKFKNLQYLEVSDALTPLTDDFFFSQDSTVKSVLKRFSESDKEFGIVGSREDFKGAVTMIHLFTVENKGNYVKEYLEKIPVFAPNDSLTHALNTMKKNKEPISVVVEEGMAKGVLLANEILYQML